MSNQNSENEALTEFDRGFDGTPDGFWILSQIVNWIVFGETEPPVSFDSDALVDRACQILLSSCAERRIKLLGTQVVFGTVQEIPWSVFSNAIWFSLSGNSIEADEDVAPKAFVMQFLSWKHIRALERDVRELWPISLATQGMSPSGDVTSEQAATSSPGTLSDLPLPRRAPTPEDAAAFKAFVEDMFRKTRKGPTREEAEKFAMDRNINSRWGRERQRELDNSYKRERGERRVSPEEVTSQDK